MKVTWPILIAIVTVAACGKSETVEVKVEKADKPVTPPVDKPPPVPASFVPHAALEKLANNIHGGEPWKPTIDSFVAVLGLPHEKSATQANWYQLEDATTCSYVYTARAGDKLDGFTYEIAANAGSGGSAAMSFEECQARSKKSRKPID